MIFNPNKFLYVTTNIFSLLLPFNLIYLLNLSPRLAASFDESEEYYKKARKYYEADNPYTIKYQQIDNIR